VKHQKDNKLPQANLFLWQFKQKDTYSGSG